MVQRALAAVKRALPLPLRNAFKQVRSAVRGARRLTERAVTREDLSRSLARAGIRAGDCVVVHSSLARLGYIDGGAAAVLAAIRDALGADGTLLMPAFCSAEEAIARSAGANPIDLRSEPSQTGSITEHLRRHPDARRSSHPFSSIVAIGPRARYICEAHDADPRICHPSSPLARLLEVGGKIVGLGVDLGPVSFYHVVEDVWDGFPFETYATDRPVVRYIAADGREVCRPIAYYDRAVSRTRIDQDEGAWIRHYLTEHLRKRGILHEFAFGKGPAWWMDARELYEELRRLAARGITIYSTRELSSV